MAPLKNFTEEEIPTMQLTFFTIPVGAAEDSETALNQFLNQNKIVNVEKNFVADGANSFWALCITSALSREKSHKPGVNKKISSIDYREVLSPEEFAVFAELRKLRKQISDAEGIPAYAVFTNAQLAKIVTDDIQNKTDLGTIEGIGQARVAKYGSQFLACMENLRKQNESPRQ